nr:unnamed protein product [Callosobruchus chinensis]
MNQLLSIASDIKDVKNCQTRLSNDIAECKSLLEEHSDKISQHDISIQRCLTDIQSLRSAQADMSTNLTAIEHRFTALQENSANSASSTPAAPAIPDRSSDVEMLERYRRSHNILIKNVAENANSNDNVTVSEVLNIIDPVANGHVISVSRLGAPQANRSRPLKISFSNPVTVKNILKPKKSLLSSPSFKHFIIDDDKTPHQMAQLVQLREDLRRRQAAGERYHYQVYQRYSGNNHFADAIFHIIKKLNSFEWSICYSNVQSLNSKFLELLAFVDVYCPTFICLTETWLHPGLPDSGVSIPGCHIYRSDSVTTPRHGGVCVFVKDSIKSSFTLSPFSDDLPGIGNMFLSVKHQHFSFIFGCIYIPRPAIFDANLCKLIEDLSTQTNNLYITGDFNLHDISWPLTEFPICNSRSAPFLDLLRDTCITQLIDCPTRFRNNQTPRTLDLVFVNDTDFVSDIDYLPPFGKSDHCTLLTKLQFSIVIQPSRLMKNIKRMDYLRLNRCLLEVDWNLLFQFLDTQSMWDVFLDKLRLFISKCTSYRTITTIPKKPWINENILGLVRHKKALWQKYNRSKRQTDFGNHRNFSNSLSKTLADAKRCFEKQLVHCLHSYR